MNRLKALREEKGMKQSELGKLLNVQDAAISKYESGKIPLTDETLLKLSKIFSVPVDYILGISEKRVSDEDSEWRYPPVQNRLGTILNSYCSKNKIKDTNFAKRLGISTDLLSNIKLGVYTPTIPLLNKIAEITGYDIDYLTGAQSSTSVVSNTLNTEGQNIEEYLIESDHHFRARFEENCLSEGITDENVSERLGLSHNQYIDIMFNRMPTLSELLRISYGFGVSIDFLIGKTDIPSISQTETKLLNAFSKLTEDNQDIIIGKTKELLREQRFDNPPVAADGERKASGK